MTYKREDRNSLTIRKTYECAPSNPALTPSMQSSMVLQCCQLILPSLRFSLKHRCHQGQAIVGEFKGVSSNQGMSNSNRTYAYAHVSVRQLKATCLDYSSLFLHSDSPFLMAFEK